jgi:methionyl-tRNA formyltransferase
MTDEPMARGSITEVARSTTGTPSSATDQPANSPNPEASRADAPTPASGVRILCIGANLESRIALEGLIAQGVNVVGLVTLPERSLQAGSDHADLRPLCRLHDIPCIETDGINEPATVDAMAGLTPDYLFTLGWSQLMRPEVLAVPRAFAVGSHPSALPAGRGRAPIPWMILQDERRGTVSLFRMEPGADAGPLLVQRPFDVPPRADATQLYQLAAETLRDAWLELHRAILDGTLRQVAQDEARATWRARRVPADGHLDFDLGRDAVDRLVRAVTHPYPGAYTWLDGQRVGVWRSSLDDVPAYLGTSGQILARRDGRLLVHAGDGPLWLSELTLDDEPVAVERFPLGERFGVRVEDELVRLRHELGMTRQALDETRAELRQLRAEVPHP